MVWDKTEHSNGQFDGNPTITNKAVLDQHFYSV